MSPPKETTNDVVNQNAKARPSRAVMWPRVNLGDLCDLVNGDAYRESDWSMNGIPIIRIQNLNNPDKPFNHWAGHLENRVVVKDGDVLLAWSGTPGTSFGAHIWDRGPGVLNQHIFRVDLDRTRIDPRWAVVAINEQLDEMIGRAHGAVGLRHVTRKEVESLKILLPPLEEQGRMSAQLHEQTTEVARARAALKTQLDVLRKVPAAILRNVFHSPEAQGWPREPLNRLCELLPSKSISRAGDATINAITTACLTETGFQAEGIKRARMLSRDAEQCRVQPGEILVARSNTPELVGRASMYAGEPPGVFASDLTIRIRAGDGLIPQFLCSYLSSLFVLGYWKERASGASGSMKKITRSEIEGLPVPVPPPEAQRVAADHLDSQLHQARGLKSYLQDGRKEQRRGTILHATGDHPRHDPDRRSPDRQDRL